uniref:Uncharacterized protein n=1 Tax=Panagrolaimus sp. ES5 TaxID=591445 RepID=A0AC34FIN0_9BILA
MAFTSKDLHIRLFWNNPGIPLETKCASMSETFWPCDLFPYETLSLGHAGMNSLIKNLENLCHPQTYDLNRVDVHTATAYQSEYFQYIHLKRVKCDTKIIGIFTKTYFDVNGLISLKRKPNDIIEMPQIPS